MTDQLTISPLADGLTYFTRIHAGTIVSLGLNNPFLMIAPPEGSDTLVLTLDELLELAAKAHEEKRKLEAKVAEVLAAQSEGVASKKKRTKA